LRNRNGGKGRKNQKKRVISAGKQTASLLIFSLARKDAEVSKIFDGFSLSMGVGEEDEVALRTIGGRPEKGF
jgi:hypothetical protein